MIEIVAGTNRPGSKTIQLAQIIRGLYDLAGAPAQILDLAALPVEIFQPASYKTKPAAFAPFQERILACKGIHMVVPEYNGSFPGALKYFIDMLKFPESLEHRPIAYTGLADGLWGGFRAVEQLQMVCNYRNAYGLPERVWFPHIGKKMQDNRITDEFLFGLLRDQVERFIKFANHHEKEAVHSIPNKSA